MDVIEHLNEPGRTLLECRRVLSRGGLVVVGTPNMANLENRVSALLGRSIYHPLDEWLNNDQRFIDGEFRRFIGHVREHTMDELCSMIGRYGFGILLRRYFASHVQPWSGPYRIYALLERLNPRFAYHMLMIGQKTHNQVILLVDWSTSITLIQSPTTGQSVEIDENGKVHYS